MVGAKLGGAWWGAVGRVVSRDGACGGGGADVDLDMCGPPDVARYGRQGEDITRGEVCQGDVWYDLQVIAG